MSTSTEEFMKSRLTFTIFIVLLLVSSQALGIEARLRIGVVRPKSGDTAPLGQELWQGIQLALNQHRARTPLIKPLVEIIEADDAGSPSQAQRAAEDLLQRQRVHALIGSVNNVLNQGIADAAIRMNRLTILPFATQDKLISRSEMLFSVSFSEQEQGALIAQFASQELARKSAVILSEKDNPYSLSLAAGFRQSFSAAGGHILAELNYEPEATDNSELLAQISRNQIDLVFIPGFFRDVARLVNALKPRVSGSTVFIGGDGWDDPNIARLLPVSAGSYYYFTPFSLNANSQEIVNFIHAYQRDFKTQPSALAYFGYAAMDTLLSTYLRANSNRSEALSRQLTRFQEVSSLLGPFQVTATGSIVRPAPVMTISSGQTRLFRTIEPKF